LLKVRNVTKQCPIFAVTLLYLKRIALHRSLLALLLALLFSATWLLKAGHALWDHAGHSEPPVPCAVGDHDQGTHWHDGQHHDDQCAMCQAMLGAIACPGNTETESIMAPLGAAADLPTLLYKAPCIPLACDSICRRGPPAL
jgi:hypothetical protein